MSTTPLDLSNIWGTPNQNQSGSNTPQQSGALDLSGIWGGSPMATIPGQSPLPSLQTGHDESDRFDTEDPNDNWLEKGWHFLNKPLTETLFGWGEYRHGAGGLERGTEKVLSGLFSPLSLGLLAAFAPAGIAEGVGGTVLKEGLMEGGTALGEGALDEVAAASKIEQYAKAVQAAKKAQVSGNSIKEAVSAATNSEMPYQEFLNYGQYLKSNGLQETDMLGESFARRSASRGLKMAGFTPAKAMNIAKGAETLVNMGFAYQQVKGAVYAVPRIADLMSHGDYDDAAEYMVEGAVGGVFGGLAFAHGLHSVNDLIKVDEANQLPLSDEAELMKSIGNTMDLEYQKDNINISERKRQRMSEFLDLIGMPVPAKYQLGTWSEVGPTKEFSSALSEIFTTKSKREHLEQKQLEFFHRMDLGNSPLAAHQLRNALIQGYKLEDKVPNYHPPDIPMTVDDIAKGEISNRAFDMARLRGVSQKVSSLDSELSGFSNALKEAEPEEQEQLKQLISAKTQERNTLSLEQSRLQGITDEAKDWERMNEEFVPKPEGYASEDEENAAKQDFYKQREERNLGLVRNYYNKLNAEVKEALRTKVVGDKFDPNKIDDARIIANNIRDMKVIEQAYPEFSQTENGEQSSGVEASRTDEPFEAAKASGGKIKMGTSSSRLAQVLGSSLYQESSGHVITKELLQNAMDAIRGTKDGNVKAHVDAGKGSITISDNGVGMTRKELETVFTDLGSTGKGNMEGASGGFGLAKAAPFMMSKKLIVETVAKSKGKFYRSSFVATPEEMLGNGVQVDTEEIPATDEFGHPTSTGTHIQAFLKNPVETEDSHAYLEKARLSTKLPGTLNATFGHSDIGQVDIEHPKQNVALKRVATLLAPGANIELAASPDSSESTGYGGVQVEVNNNGIFQFNMYVDSMEGIRIPKRVSVDIKATSPEGDRFYPFSANRESLRNETKQMVEGGVQKYILEQAVQNKRNEVSRLYHSLPTLNVGNGEIPLFDSGGRLTPEELEILKNDPAVQEFGTTMKRLGEDAVKTLREKGSSDAGKNVKRWGLVLSSDVHGVYIPDPKNPSHVTIFLNPFERISKDTHPAEASSSAWHTIVHELTHDVAKGHNENFTMSLHGITKALGKQEIRSLIDLEQTYADPNDIDRIRPDLDRAFQIYRESRGREETTPDIFRGEKSGTGPESGEGSGKPTDRSVQSGREETISGNPEASGISRTIDYLKKQLDSFLAKGGDKSNPEVQRTEVRLGFLKKKLDQIVSKLGLRPDGPEGGTPPQQPPVPPSEAQEPPTPSEPELPGKNWRPVLPPELYQPPEWRQHLEGWMSEHFPIHPWMDSAQHPLLPHNINELVQKARAKNWNKDQIDEIMRHVNALERIETTPLTEKEKGFYDNLVKDEQGNWTTGYMHGIINSIVDNHIHHIWGEDDDIGNHLKQLGASGSFSINATQARHRSFATAAEGLLMGKKLKVSDPIALAAHDANNVAQAAAHRKFLETLRNGVIAKDGSHMKVYDPEGMPAVVMFGRGYEVPGVDGDSSSILVNPNRVRNIEMEPWEIQRLQKAGLLDTYLKDGRVVDKTPEATIDNVKDWIQKTNKQIGSLEEKNPLLAGGKESLDRHKEAWKQLQVIAKQQAEKISDYLDKALHKIVYEQGTDGSGYYKGVSIDEKPNDISLAKSIDKKLHGGTISPKDLQRLQDYADRNRMYADGLSSFDSGESELRPSEISRLIRQESDFLPPELKKYLFDVHDLLNWNEKKGENGKEYEWPLREDNTWTRKGLNKSIKYIAHAAENKVYPQLIKDLSDLKYVDNVLHPDPVTGYVPWKESDTPKIINPVTMEEHRPEAEARLKDINERQEKKYLWAPKSHISIDHHAFRKYNWMASAPDGTPTLAESDMGVSKYFYKYMVNRMGLEPSWVRQNPVTNKILKTTQGAKNLLLSFSPFHIVQEALRGAMLGINPFYRPNPLERLDETRMTARGPLKIDELGVKNNLTTFSDRHMAEDHSVGVSSHGGIVSKIPVYGRIADQIHDFLFNRYIPDLKVRGFRRMFDKYAESHPDWTNDAVARAAADHVNSAFGGINWRALGRSATTQDWFHIFALAPDWLESEVRFMTSVFQNSGIGPAKYQPESGKNIARQQVITAAVALWTSARVLNLLSTGKAHFEAPFGVAHKDKDGKETIYSVRTLPTDILHAASDPTGFLVGRESPFVRTSLEAYTGRNQYGQKLTPGERYVDMISNLSPIWGQSVLKQVTNLSTSSDVGFGSQIAKSAGATAQVYRTPAQKEAADLAAERSEEGAMNPQMISRHRLLLQLEDDMRGGRINVTDLTHMVNQGAIPEADAKEIVKNVRETAGQDPEEARLYSRVSRMDWQGSIAVWDVANPSEKQMLERVIIKKAKSYLSKARKNFTPNEIMKDPLFKRAQQMAPMIQPETE